MVCLLAYLTELEMIPSVSIAMNPIQDPSERLSSKVPSHIVSANFCPYRLLSILSIQEQWVEATILISGGEELRMGDELL